ncbi:unnamed protein product [Rhizoctonia solani]|uniref:Uncharacterized protein n=1 Tax=Rhizoctonia solani TaxID=456999 RepID=A0A8H3BC77_9AGAM|nr:unnamed protein product [Rhizoctonia solani]
MAEHNFENHTPAYLHPKLEDDGSKMVMELNQIEPRLVFVGELKVEAPLGPSEAKPNGTFHYNKLPASGPLPIHALYYRDLEGPKEQLVRIKFAENPDESATQLGYYESYEQIPTLIFINGAQGPGNFIEVPKHS